MKINANLAKKALNLYPPYLGAGIKIKHISKDFKTLHVSMKRSWYNRNYVGTHFGGSLYSMVDPHLMLLLMQCLGNAYYVWDKAAEIDFIKATQETVSALIHITDEDIEDIKAKTQDGQKYLPEFWIEIKDPQGELIAKVKKTLYIKRKK